MQCKMEKEAVKVVRLSELIQRSRPVTGAASLHSNSSRPFSPPQPNEPSQHSDSPSQSDNQNPGIPRVLKPLNSPTILIGTLTLPTPDLLSGHNRNLRCSNSTCFQFSDGSSTICCDTLDLDIRILGKTIQVLSWNFIPMKSGGGFLEIIRWSFPESLFGINPCSSNAVSFPLVPCPSLDSQDIPKARNGIQGKLESVSPVSVVPCAVGASGSQNVSGFLAQILVCECKLCKTKALALALQKDCYHCFTKPVTVYFVGSASSWHPVMSRLIDKFVSISGLKKKLVYLGKEESQLMYVTTEKASLQLLNLKLPREKTVIKGKGECGRYNGTITGVYMQGVVIELDREVLLLLTDPLVARSHGLRIGAIVSVLNVHFVKPNYSWTSILVLGACARTSICVMSFSPMETGCYMNMQSQSPLGKFIDSLAFSARLWVLLAISCFRRKFVGVLSEKEILGSTHKEGLLQAYARSHLSSTVHSRVIREFFWFPEHGKFTEYCKHDTCDDGNVLNDKNLKLVVPISNFRSHCEAMWIKMLLEQNMDFHILGNTPKESHPSCEGRHYHQPVRRILHSEDMGVVLLGTMKISPSSGRLQFIDATGNIDVIIADLYSTWNFKDTCEVNNFVVVMEGVPELEGPVGSLCSEPFSCKSIFNSIPLARGLNLTIYLYLKLQDQKFRNDPFSPYKDKKMTFGELESGRFHLLQVTHKFPVLQKFQGDRVNLNRLSVFAEAIILPWDLFVAGKDEDAHLDEHSVDSLKESKEYHASRNRHEHVTHKRHKVDKSSNGTLNDDKFGSTCCSRTCGIFDEEQKYSSSCLVEIPCFVTGRNFEEQFLLGSGILCCTKGDSKIDTGSKPLGWKVLLEFMPESFCKYELLRIGSHYIIKHNEEDTFCTIRDCNVVSGGRVAIDSETHMWSLSFSSEKFLLFSNPVQNSPFCESVVSNKEVLLSGNSCQTELPLLNLEHHENNLEINLILSADVMSFLEVNFNVSEALDDPENISLHSGTVTTASMQFLPEGNLISLQGDVVSVHNSDSSSLAVHLSHISPCDSHQPKAFPEWTGSICIHVLTDNHIVKIFGALNKNLYPVGFGPGVNASFLRILISREQNEFMLTPVSFIVVNSMRISTDQHGGEYNSSLVDSCSKSVPSTSTVPTALFFGIFPSLEHKQVQFNCRIVAIYVLVLEMDSVEYLQPSFWPRRSAINIPLAGFVLDDGSFSCCSWTDCETAAMMLKLDEKFPHEASERNFWGSWTRIQKACSSKNDLLHNIVKRHGRIVVKNHGSLFDSSCQDLIFSVGSDKVIGSSDEDLLKVIIFNASYMSSWTVVGSLMGVNAVGQLEQCLTKLEMAMHPLPNIWATKVHPTNPLKEARNLVQELLNT